MPNKGENVLDWNKSSQGSNIQNKKEDNPLNWNTTSQENNSSFATPAGQFGESKYDKGITVETQADTPEIRAQKQPTIDRWANAVPRFLSKTAIEVAKTPGYLAGVAEGVFTNKPLAETLNNAWVNTLDNLDQKTKEKFAVYTPKAVKEGNLWDNVSSASFWTNEGVDGAAFLFGMMAPGAAIKGLGLASKTSKLLNISAKAGESIELGTATLLNTTLESAAEATGVVQDLKTQFKDKVGKEVNPSTGQPWTQEEVDSHIGEAAKNTFLMNMALLVGPDFIMNKNLLGRFTPTKNILNKITDEAGNIVPLTQLTRNEIAGEYAKKAGVGLISEGFVEEGGQNAIQKYNSNIALENTNEGWLTGLANTYADLLGETDTQKAIFLGGLFGSVGGAIGTRKEIKGEQEYLSNLSEVLSRNFEGFTTDLNKIYKKDENGVVQIDPETNSPIIDQKEAIKYVRNIAKEEKSSGLLDMYATLNNKEAYDFVFNENFTRFSKPYLEIDGGEEVLNKQIDNLSKKYSEQLKESEGVDNTLEENKFKSTLKTKVRELKKQYESISDELSKGEFDTFDATPVQINEFSNRLKLAALSETSRQMFYNEKISELNKDIFEIDSSLSGTLPQNQKIKTELEIKKTNYQALLDKSVKEYSQIFDPKAQEQALREFVSQDKQLDNILTKVADKVNKANTPVAIETTDVVVPTGKKDDVIKSNTFNRLYNTPNLPEPTNKQEVLSVPIGTSEIRARINPFEKKIQPVLDQTGTLITKDIKVKSPSINAIVSVNGVDMGYLPYTQKYVDKNGKTITDPNKLKPYLSKDIDFDTFATEYRSLVSFENRVNNYIKTTKPDSDGFVTIPESFYSTKVIGQLDFAEFEERPELEGNQLFNIEGKGYHIFDTLNQKFLAKANNFTSLSEAPQTDDTYALAVLPNGIQQWVKLTPKTKKANIVEVENAIKTVLSKLEDSLGEPLTAPEITSLLASIDTFIASKSGDSLKFKIDSNKDNEHKLYVLITKDNESLDKRYKAWVPKDFNSIEDVIKSVNKNNKGITINQNSFRDNVPKDAKIDQNNAKLFQTVTKPNVLTNFNVKFTFNEGEVIKETKPKVKEEIVPAKQALSKPSIKSEINRLIGLLDNEEPGSEIYTEIDIEITKLEQELANETLNQAQGITQNPLSPEDTDEALSTGEALKISQEAADQIIDYKEAKTWLEEKLPNQIKVEDIDNIASSLSKNGITWGAFKNKVIYLSKEAQKGTEYHEAFHAVFRTLLTNEQINNYIRIAKREANLLPSELERSINKLKSISDKYKSYSDKQLEDLVYEEYIADKYMDWNKKPSTVVGNVLKSLYSKIKQLVNWLTGENNFDTIFSRINRGYFKNSEIVNNKFTKHGFDEVYKILPGKTVVDSEDIINTISSLVMESVINGSPLTIKQVIDSNIELYDPRNNKDKFDELESSEQKRELSRALSKEYSFYNDADVQKLIKEQVAKTLLKYDYDSIANEFNEYVDDENSERNFDSSFFEFGGEKSVSKEIRQFIGLTLYDTIDRFGNPIRKAVDFQQVYPRLEGALVGTKESSIIPKMLILSNYNEQIKAVTNNLITKTGWSEESPYGTGINEQALLKRFYKAFERGKLNYLQSLVMKDGGFDVFSANQRDAAHTIIDKWGMIFTELVEDRYLKDPKYKQSLITKLNKTLAALNDNSSNETLELVKQTFEDLGIELSVPTIELSFGDNTKEDVIELQNAFSDLRKISTEDIREIKRAITEDINLFSDSGVYGRLLEIANTESVFNENPFSDNFRDANGKTRYSKVFTNFVIDKTQFLKDRYTNEQNTKQDTIKGYNAYNYLLRQDPQIVADTFSTLDLALIGDIRSAEEVSNEKDEDAKIISGKGVTFKNTDAKSFLLNLHAIFSNREKNAKTKGQELAWFLGFIPESKNSPMAFRLPVDDSLYNNGISDRALEIIYNNIFIQEVNRLKGEFGDKFQNRRFANLSFLNNAEFDELLDIKRVEPKKPGIPYEQWQIQSIGLVDIVTVKNRIKEHIKEGFEAEINKQLAQIKDFNIEDKLDQTLITKLGGLNNYVGSYIINGYINVTSIMQLVQGDIAIAKDSVDATKRNGGIVAAGITTNDFTVAYVTDTKADIDPELGEKEIDRDDAQVLTTTDAFTRKLASMGRVNKNLVDVLNKLNNPKIVKGKPQWPTEKEIKDSGLDMISMKLVTYGNDTDGNTIYHKMSVFPITKQLTSYYEGGEWKPIPGKEVLHNKRIFMEKNGIDQLIPKTASKMYTGTKFDAHLFGTEILNDDQPLPENFTYKKTKNEDGTFTSNPYKISGQYQRLQVENNSKKTNQIVSGSQFMQLIDTELPNTPENQVLRKQYYDLLDKVRQQSMAFSVSMLIKENGQKANLTRFLKKLQENVDNSNPDAQMNEFLEAINEDFKYDPNLPHVLERFESLFLSHFQDGVLRQKVAGKKLTLVSDAGYQILFNESNGQVIDREKFLSDPKSYKGDNFKTRDLRIHKPDGDKLGFAEVAMPRIWKELHGLNIGDNIPNELLEGIGFRIPTDSHHSMVPFKVVEFLPEYYGDVVIVPKEVSYLAGSDFDVDSLFTYRYDIYRNNNGEVKKFGDATTPEGKYEEYRISWSREKEIKKELVKLRKNSDKYGLLTSRLDDIQEDYLKAFILLDNKQLAEEIVKLNDEFLTQALDSFNLASTQSEFEARNEPETNSSINNKLVDIYKKVLTNPEIWESIKTPTSISGFEEDAKMLMELTGEREGVWLHNTINGQFDHFYNNKMGASLVGNAANTNIISAFLTKMGVNLNPDFAIEIDGKKYDTFAVDKEDDVTISDKKVTINEGVRRKNETLGGAVNVATDNAKERIAVKLGWTVDNLTHWGVLHALGIGRTRTSLISKQPIIKELNDRFAKANTAIDPQGNAFTIINDLLKEKLQELGLKDIYVGENNPITSQELYDNLANPTKEFQIKVLAFFNQLDKIAKTFGDVQHVLKINKGLGTNFDDIDKTTTAINRLYTKPEELPFNVKDAIENNANAKGNIQLLSKLNKVINKFFIKRTQFFQDTYNKLEKSLNVDFLSKDTIIKAKNDLFNYLAFKAYSKASGKNFSEFNNLLYPGLESGSKTLLNQFSDLLSEKEFKDNPLVKFLSTKRASDVKNKSNLDLIIANSNIKLGERTKEKFTDGFTALRISQNPKIRAFADNMINYLIVKDNFVLRNDSFIRFIAPYEFQQLANSLKELNKLLAISNPSDSELERVTGLNNQDLQNEFINNYSRHVTNQDSIKKLRNFEQFNKLVIKPDYFKIDGILYKNVNGNPVVSNTFGTWYQGYMHQSPKANEQLTAKVKALPKIEKKQKEEGKKGLSKEQLEEQVGKFKDIFSKHGVNVNFVYDPTIKSSASVIKTGINEHTVKLNPNKTLGYEAIAHEVSHIYVDALGWDSKLVKDGIAEAKRDNPELWKWVQDNYTEDYNGDIEEIEKELLVQVMGKEANSEFNTPKWLQWFNKLWEKLGNIFGITPSVAKQLFNDIIEEKFKVELETKNRVRNIERKLIDDSNPREVSKQEQFLYRRISRLTKELELATSEVKKQSLNEELDYTKGLLEQSQNTEDKSDIYKQFGEHTLGLAERKIDNLLEGNTSDINKDLEYINDVLDVWDDFVGLRDKTGELRNKIQGLMNDLVEKEVNENYPGDTNINIDEIKAQNKDIGTFKKLFGSLLDIPNYIAHTIGSIIRSSQNKIEAKTNKIFDEINEKVKELSKKSGKEIQSIYNQIITINKFGNKQLIREEDLEGKSKEAKEFYKFYQDKMQELMELTPTLTRKNEDGELETFTLNKYFIPNISNDDLKSRLKKLALVKERKLGDRTRDEEQKADIIGIDYIKTIPAKDKSDDLGNALFLFAKSIYNYDEMSSILPKVRLLQREIEKTSYIQGSDPNITKTGKDSNMWKIVDGFINAQVKGEFKELQGRPKLYTTTNEKGETVEKYLDITGSVDNLLRWNSMLRIGLSPIGSTANIGFGKLSNFMESIGGRFFTGKDLRIAERIFWNQNFDKDSVLNKELLEKYNILQELADYESIKSSKTTNKLLSKENLVELLYSPQKYGEKYIQSSTLLAIMHKEGYISREGKLTDKFNNSSDKEKEELFAKVTGINNRLHGRYSPKEAAIAQQNVVFRAIMQFRKWIPAAIETRLDEKHFDPRLGVEVEGTYRTFSRAILGNLPHIAMKNGVLKIVKGDIRSAFYNLVMPIINAKEALESGKLTESDIYNMRKMFIESVLALGTMVLYGIGTGGGDSDEDKRKKAWFKSTMLVLNRVSGDLAFFYSPSQINNLTKNAVPMSKLTGDLISIAGELPFVFNSDKNKFKTGNNKGLYKLPTRLLGVIPGNKVITEPFKVFNKRTLSDLK
jgi:hypothetical protein